MNSVSLNTTSPQFVRPLDQVHNKPDAQRPETAAAPSAAGTFVLEYMRATYTPPSGQQSPIGGDRPWSPCCDVPPPGRGDLASAPAGRGLTKDADGSVTTAGGYKIVPEGKEAAWSIYDPEGKQLTRVWGDPHVSEADGTKWDFTKDSTFMLPDGTRIGVDTTAETGQSVSKGLDIANGRDRVKIEGIDGDKPRTGEVTRDGLRGWQQDNTRDRDTFKLRHDAENQDWVKFSGAGERLGVVTGAELRDGSYEQITSGAGSEIEQARGPRKSQGLEEMFGRGGPRDVFNERTPHTDSAMGFLDLLSKLFGGNGLGGMGQNGGSPESGFQALEQLQQLLFQALMSSQMQNHQLDMNRYAGINGLGAR